MGVQILKTDDGDELIVLSRRDYDALLARAGDDDAEDRMTLVIAAESRAEAPLPESVSAAILGGGSILKSLRNWRGLTQAERSRPLGVVPTREIVVDDDGLVRTRRQYATRQRDTSHRDARGEYP